MDHFQRQKNSVVKNSTSSCFNSCERATKSEFHDPELQLKIPHVAILVKIFNFFFCILVFFVCGYRVKKSWYPKFRWCDIWKKVLGFILRKKNHSHYDHALERISHVVWSLFRIALLISDCQTHIKNIFSWDNDVIDCRRMNNLSRESSDFMVIFIVLLVSRQSFEIRMSSLP